MRITTELLKKYDACEDQVKPFSKSYPNGIEASGENAILLAAEGFDVSWAVFLLPQEGPGSQRAFALWCAEQVAHLSDDPRVAQCLEVVRAEVLHPGSQDLTTAWVTAWAAVQSTTRISVHRPIIRTARTAAAHTVFEAAARPILCDATAWSASRAASLAVKGSMKKTARNAMWEANLFMLGEMLKEL